MERAVESTYDAHTLADTFLRYTSSPRLLSLLATNLGTRPDERHLDVGFSGRLGLFSGLAPDLTVMNLSATQIALGQDLLTDLVRYHNETTGRGAGPPPPGAGDYIWDRRLPAELAGMVRRAIDEQIGVLASHGRTPHLPRCFRPVLGDITYAENLIPDASIDSLVMIDILLHITDLRRVCDNISRVLAPAGSALFTFYPLGGGTGSRGVADLFADLASKHGVETARFIDESQGIVHPHRLQELIESGGVSLDPAQVKRFWLDLSSFRLYQPNVVLDAVRAAGLRVDQVESVPGGMFPAERFLVLASRQ
jgi:hypothetical protein